MNTIQSSLPVLLWIFQSIAVSSIECAVFGICEYKLWLYLCAQRNGSLLIWFGCYCAYFFLCNVEFAKSVMDKIEKKTYMRAVRIPIVAIFVLVFFLETFQAMICDSIYFVYNAVTHPQSTQLTFLIFILFKLNLSGNWSILLHLSSMDAHCTVRSILTKSKFYELKLSFSTIKMTSFTRI